MRLIDADAFERRVMFDSEIEDLQDVIYALRDYETIADAVAVVRRKDCEYFDLDHFENVRGIPLIVAHEICNRWGNGCKTDSNGFCFMGEEKKDV